MANKKIYIGITIITVAIIAVVIVYYFSIVKPKEKAGSDSTFEEKVKQEAIANKPEGSSTSNVGTTASIINNATVFKVTNPLSKADRIQWIQYYYNKYAKLRNQKKKVVNIAHPLKNQPDLEIISEDGVYGNKTATAVNQIMGKRETNWNDFKAKVDVLTANLNG